MRLMRVMCLGWSHACQQNYVTLLPGFPLCSNLAEEDGTEIRDSILLGLQFSRKFYSTKCLNPSRKPKRRNPDVCQEWWGDIVLCLVYTFV